MWSNQKSQYAEVCKLFLNCLKPSIYLTGSQIDIHLQYHKVPFKLGCSSSFLKANHLRQITVFRGFLSV